MVKLKFDVVHLMYLEACVDKYFRYYCQALQPRYCYTKEERAEIQNKANQIGTLGKMLPNGEIKKEHIDLLIDTVEYNKKTIIEHLAHPEHIFDMSQTIFNIEFIINYLKKLKDEMGC